jgi:DNA-binding protein H-NS
VNFENFENFDDMKLDELEKLKSDVEAAIERTKARNRDEALAKIEQIARDAGLSPDDLVVAGGTKRKYRKASGKHPVRYRNPNNVSQEWSGLGRKPKWIIEAEEQGKSKEDFAI